LLILFPTSCITFLPFSLNIRHLAILLFPILHHLLQLRLPPSSRRGVGIWTLDLGVIGAYKYL
jgi:hypothetical protein